MKSVSVSARVLLDCPEMMGRHDEHSERGKNGHPGYVLKKCVRCHGDFLAGKSSGDHRLCGQEPRCGVDATR